MLTDNIADIRRYAIMFPKPWTDSFLMCKGCAEFITRYPREYEGAPFDELRLNFEGFRVKIEDQARYIDGVRVYFDSPNPRVIACSPHGDGSIGTVEVSDNPEDILEAIEEVLENVAM